MTKTQYKNIRFELELTQQAMADRLNVSIDAVRKWEQGVQKPSEANEYKYKKIMKEIK